MKICVKIAVPLYHLDLRRSINDHIRNDFTCRKMLASLAL